MIKQCTDLEIELYSSIETLPIVNFQEFSRCFSISLAIGSDIESLGGLVGETLRYNEIEDKRRVDILLSSMTNCLSYMLNGVSPMVRAFSYLIRNLNKEYPGEIKDSTIARITEVLDSSGVTVKVIKKWLQEANDQYEVEFDIFFPGKRSSIGTVKYNSLLKKKTSAILQEVISGVGNEEAEKVEKKILREFAPKKYDGSDGEEVKMVKRFNDLCATLELSGVSSPKNLTTLEFYQMLDLIERKNKNK